MSGGPGMAGRGGAEPEDVQGRADARRVAIDRVGIRDIRHPVRLRGSDRGAGGEQTTVATFSMSVQLAERHKGTHMSRFVELLNRHDDEITIPSFRRMLEEMTGLLGAERGRIEMRFPWFVAKRAPVTGVESLMDYPVTLIGERADGRSRVSLRVEVPATSLCPCSRDISDYGAHNQRSLITLEARIEGPMWIEELIGIAEREASCEVWGVLKRADEKYVTERAYDNPKFVEDIVRDVALALDAEERVRGYRIEVENFESIHNHSAFAVIEKDKG